MDIADVDEEGRGRLFFGEGTVTGCCLVAGQTNITLLETKFTLEREGQRLPEPGQFYMLKAVPSKVSYFRPISVYHSEYTVNPDGKRTVSVQFMILCKGTGTEELVSSRKGDKVELIGPLGNSWLTPLKDEGLCIGQEDKVCIVGGGIGVAPAANLAFSLADESYDFYASFRTGSYGLENIKASKLVITTDDGSAGIKGMLTVALTEENITDYKYVFACGPAPMLAYVQSLCMRSGVKCYLSMEHRMLCGVGACLGCTIDTTEGLQRVCKDGPVFKGETIRFQTPRAKRCPLPEGIQPDMSFTFKGITFKNPVIASAGTFGYGQNYRGLFDVSVLGGIASKGCTLEPRAGNTGERCIEMPIGNMNSIGLQNPGIQYYIDNLLPPLMELGPVIMTNLAGSTKQSYVDAARLLEKTNVPMMELNISCPNVAGNGDSWGQKADTAFELVSAVRSVFSRPISVKLGPDVPDVTGVAMACILAGADALSLVNMYHGVAIDIENEAPFFKNVHAGYSGPGIKPLALRIVYDVYEEMLKLPEEKRIPIFGIGGISSAKDAIEYIMAGASCVEIGAAKFNNPNVIIEVIDGIRDFMKTHGYRNLAEMRGKAHIFMPYRSME